MVNDPYEARTIKRIHQLGKDVWSAGKFCWTSIVDIYIHLYSPERQQQQVKKAPNTQQKQTNKREEKNYAQIGQASEQFSGLDVTQNEANEENKLLKTVTQ